MAASLIASVLSSPEQPAVNVTRSQAWEGMVTLTCWAFGFSLRNISLTWLQDEEPLSQEAQQSGGVLPYGNDTYHTWVAIRIPQGEEQRFMCHVEHSGNHTAHPVPSGEPGMLLEGVLPLVGSGARVGERRACLCSGCPGYNKAVFQERPWRSRVDGHPFWGLLLLVPLLCMPFGVQGEDTSAAESSGEKLGQWMVMRGALLKCAGPLSSPSAQIGVEMTSLPAHWSVTGDASWSRCERNWGQ